MIELSISEFAERLKQEQSEIERKILQLTYDVAAGIRDRAIMNADQLFNWTVRTNSRGREQAGSKGSLRNSILLQMVGNYPGVTVGGVAAPHAAIHEFGGVIEPKNVDWLTIPSRPDIVGKRAREYNLKFRLLKKRDKYGNPLAELVNADNERYYLLMKHVEIPERPYVRPAIEDEASDPQIQARCLKIFGRSRLPFGVFTV